MLTSRGDERQSRKPKSENRLYKFLTRSRSRSRSKHEELQPSTKPMPDLPRSHIPSSGSKPVSRIQSRPISSNTSTTNTTITPATPKVKKRPQTHVPITPPAPVVFDSSHSSSSRPTSSRPTTPKPSATRQKLHDLFRIPLGRKSASRSRSRPSSPQLSLDIPPLPLPTHDDATPKPRRPSSPNSHRISRPRSPSPTTPRQLRVTNRTPSLVSSTAPSLKLPRFFSSRNISSIDHNRTTESNHGGPPMMVSAPLKHVSSLHRHSIQPTKYVDADPRASNLIPPQIIHTPATPLKPTKDPQAATTPSAVRLGYHALKNSLDSGFRYRGTAMGVVDEEGRAAELESKSNTEANSIEPEPVSRPGPKMNSAIRSKKHGSFDFERPGWSNLPIQRSGSNETTGTAASEWSKNTDSVHKESESTYGAGLAGVGTLQRDASVKRGQEREREEKMRTRDLGRKQTVATDKETTLNTSSTKPTPRGSATPSDNLHTSTSTNGKSNTGTEKSTAHTGKSSSMSRATGKRTLHATKTASGSGVARFIGLSTQHGPFSFEPPVPSPTRSTASNGTTHEVQVSWSKTEKERVRLRDEKERQQSKAKKNVQRGDRPPVPVPMPSTNAGHRSGTKGRSLDLGLGLAWAPSKVREEALLPSATFFTRSLSNPSNGNRSRSGSTATGRSALSSTDGNGSGRSRGGIMHQGSLDPNVQRSKLGKEVAELFKHAIDREGYEAFKTYVHQFDADEIPFDGPTGIVTRVERLLASAPGLGDEAKQRLLDKFIRIILQQA